MVADLMRFLPAAPPLRRLRGGGGRRALPAVFLLTACCVAGFCAPVRADSWALLKGADNEPEGTPQMFTSTIIGPVDGSGFVVVPGNVSTLTRIKTANLQMQQPLALVSELIQLAAANAKAARDPITALMEVWQVQLKQGDVEGAKRTLASVQQTAGSMTGAERKAGILIVIAEAQAKAGDMVGAKQTFSSAKQTAATITAATITNEYRKTSPDEYRKTLALCAIAKAQTNTGDFMGAKATIEEIADAGQKATAFANLASAILNAAKQHDAALPNPPASPAAAPPPAQKP